jgi:D-alanine-D-alanine ligase
MRLGLSFDLKDDIQPGGAGAEDALEEYDSRETVSLLADYLQAGGHQVTLLGGGRRFIENILGCEVDFVFNIAEGRGSCRSREAQVPCILEMLGIAYSGSDPLCLAVCLDKPLAKKLVALEGARTPNWRLINDEKGLEAMDGDEFTFPVIIKPAYEGSSKGIRLTSVAEDICQARAEVSRILSDYRQPVMIEQFIDGDEVTVGVIGNNPPRVLGMMRIVPKAKDERFVYSLEVKRDYENRVEYECPAQLPGAVLQKIEAASLKVFKALGCRDFARIDFRVDADGTPCFIEINPLPGLGTYSDLVIMALKLGWTHQGLVNAILAAAVERQPQCAAV